MPAVRPFNFSAGPAALPPEVLSQVAEEMLDWHGSGMSVMEMSHRGREFISIYEAAEADLRELLQVPEHFRILFMQGGGLGENAILPLNLSRGGAVDVVVTGSWSKKSAAEARRYADVRIAANAAELPGADGRYLDIPAPSTWQLRRDASYVHVCTNETIGGLEFHWTPDTGKVPLVADMSSHILSKPLDVSKFGLIYAGAQKNIGPAGLVVVIVREGLLGHALPETPNVLNYKQMADTDSMLNTPPTFSVYLAGLTFKWLLERGGLAGIEKQNVRKAKLLYDYIDGQDFYSNPIAKEDRSRMNVPFRLRDDSLDQKFLAEAEARGLSQLKGHRSVGGMRASIYNAMPLEGVEALVEFMEEFRKRH